MNDVGADFRHLKRVAKAGVNRGDVSIVTCLFQSYTDEAKRQHKFDLKRIAAMKAQELAEVMAAHNPIDLSRLPNPANDPPPAWGAVKKRAADPLARVKLNAHQQWAVAEIRAIYNATIRAVTMTMKPLDVLRVDRSRTLRNPLEYLEHFTQERLSHYFNWTWRNRRIKGIDLTGFELVCAVVIDGYGFRDLARIHGLHHYQVKREFQRVLGDY